MVDEEIELKLTKEVITHKIRKLYYRESMGWLRVIYRAVTLPNLFVCIILLCLYIIKPFKFVKLLIIRHERIGSLAGNTDLFLRRLQLEKTPQKGILYLGISGKPTNEQLLKMFKRKIPIIENTRLQQTLNQPLLRKSMFYEAIPKLTGQVYEFNDTEPNLYFTASEEEEGEKLLSKIGINRSSWFICFHSRDSVYLTKYGNNFLDSPTPQGYFDFRDSDVKNYLEAAKYIASLGGFAVRMGYGVAEKLPDLHNPRIIDYASYHRTDFGDIYLLAKCKFFLGNTAGIHLVATTFNVPVAGANWAHLNHTLYQKEDLYIPKKIWSIKEKRFLTFREILESEVADYYSNEQFTEAGLEVVENTAEEILGLAREMNERLDGTFEYTEEDEELQNRFRSLFQPHHRSYGFISRIGAEFLRQNKELLE